MAKFLKIKKSFVALLMVFAVFFITAPVFSAEIYFKTDSTTVRLGDFLEVLIFLRTEDENINAVEGTVLFPDDILKLENINEANSILTFWLEKPRIYNGNKINFSGITPGGYQEKTGLLFSANFQAKKEGMGIIEIKSGQVLLNDGKGTTADLSISNLQFLISKQAPQSKVLPIEDTEPPESFKPAIAQSPEIFDGKWFLVFATQDKGSGINKYLIHESRRKKERIATNEWTEADGPYVLRDQKLRSYIYVKAVDRAGNERIVMVEPRYPLKWYEYPGIWIIIILGVIVLCIIGKILWKKKIVR